MQDMHIKYVRCGACFKGAGSSGVQKTPLTTNRKALFQDTPKDVSDGDQKQIRVKIV